ncbi:hypothetical protein EPIR_3379 [Erwinia piriflorinigrans CFBP 5888]|uniref:Uncharacterized protein n=1 Tax=Erwinia piriflorinigrans CFBP 5888 TaxID=1161919 RepID=V5ZCI0_9GAMM|nr:hypothetical protein EPIR_3379 [Erwinia piriflorinigrans CFBP 5888]
MNIPDRPSLRKIADDWFSTWLRYLTAPPKNQ